ncbi:MAG: MotA/TolQ/ExbB proton channel family protein [Muribaculaceae bacterium]|nr:MotA/TolQ/ExbB proton channel family protein [Muribaculaceae bacterium]
MNVISNILYWISTGLLVPVIVLLIYFFLRSLILIGGFFGQYMTEKKTAAMLDKKVKEINPSNINDFLASFSDKKGILVIDYLNEIYKSADSPARLDMLVSEYELAAEKNIATSKILTKMGPILGLMGTLIPMGPALVGLATGDIASMAYNMQVAFATTVVGLVVSAIGFITQQTKERWAQHNLMILDFITETLKDKK